MNAVTKFAGRCFALVVVGIVLGLLCAIALVDVVKARRADRVRLARARALPDLSTRASDDALSDVRRGDAGLALEGPDGEADDAALFI